MIGTRECADYKEFWQTNLHNIENISKNIEKQIFNLEKKYSDFDSVYLEITNQLDVLSSIYAGYNYLNGTDYILKLKALLNNYRKRYTQEGISFHTIQFLYSKINALRDLSFSEFPALDHTQNIDDTDKKQKRDMPFKWVSFYRNGSWFISDYKTLDIQKYYHTVAIKDHNLSIKFNNSDIAVIDIFSKTGTAHKENINYILIIAKEGNSVKCYAATRIGRQIYAANNILSSQIRPISNVTRYAGKVRIFGKTHVYL